MKKILYIAATAILLGACAKPAPTNEEKAQKLINEFIMANANDPKSYEAVSFGTLDSTFSSYYASDRYKDLNPKASTTTACYLNVILGTWKNMQDSISHWSR